jgi:hypothetical protein
LNGCDDSPRISRTSNKRRECDDPPRISRTSNKRRECDDPPHVARPARKRSDLRRSAARPARRDHVARVNTNDPPLRAFRGGLVCAGRTDADTLVRFFRYSSLLDSTTTATNALPP